jgi:L-amino acid N-acyltransferase YncA
MLIRPALETDFAALWRIFQQVVAPGDTYVFAPDSSEQTAHAYWFGPGVRCFVAEDQGELVGMYKLIPNQRDLGSHVANASFMVAPARAGQGTGQQLGRHCLQEAKRAGYRAIQFNFVVSTNSAAVALWQKLGFVIVGTLPKVFRHQGLGEVDAYVMHRFLDDIRV